MRRPAHAGRFFNNLPRKGNTPLGRGGAIVRALLVPFVLALLALPTTAGLGAPLDTLVALPEEAPQHPAAAPADAAGEYRIGFRCAGANETVPTAVGCPSYVLDREDVLSQPVLLVDPLDANVIGFSAMHGGRGVQAGPGDAPPTERSRRNALHQPHTVFRSNDGGAAWEDMPYYAPDSMKGSATRQIFGEDNAAVLDGAGRLVVASLYAYRDGGSPVDGSAAHQFAVAVWKGERLTKAVDYFRNVRVLSPDAPDARIDSLHLVFVPASGNVALLWRETPAQGEPFIHLNWTPQGGGSTWRAAPEASRIGPCAEITNPVALGDRVVLGCRPDEGAPFALHAFDGANWSATPLGVTPITTPHASLLKRGDRGDLVLVGSGVVDGRPLAQLAYVDNAGVWSEAEDITQALSLTGGARLLDARVTAAAYAPRSGNLHLVYLEQQDLGAPTPQNAGRASFVKALVAIQAGGGLQARLDLGLGTIRRADVPPTYSGVGEGAFADLHDGLVVWTNPETGEEREFLAFGDYGWVRFAEVVEEGFAPPILPLSANIPPVPVASAGTIPALVGLPAGILAGAAMLRVAAARRKVTVEARNE